MKWFNKIRILSGMMLTVILVISSGHAGDLVFTDSRGVQLEMKAPPARLVSLVPSATEILFELGAQDMIAGITYHDATLDGASGKPVVGGFFLPSIEKIKQLNPDMIILSSLHTEVMAAFGQSKTVLFVYETESIEHAYSHMLTLGRISRNEPAAEDLIKKNKDQMALIREKIDNAVPRNRKRVIRLMGRDTVMTPGNDSFQNDLIRRAGGIPPDFGRGGSVIEVSQEEWTAFNPQVIYGCGRDKTAAENFFSRPGWKEVDAVKNQQIFYFPCELTCRAGAHSGAFVQWLSSMIYTDEFADSENNVLPVEIKHTRPVHLDLSYVASADIHTSTIHDFENKTLVVTFKTPQTIVSTLEGKRDNILTVGNHYSPPPTWGPGHKLGIEQIRNAILAANGKEKATTAFLVTGANMGNLSVKQKTFKEMAVTALATAGVSSNAVRMSKDTGMFYEPGTINVIIMSNMKLSDRAMTRAVISATEAKTAALEDMDIRSTYTPLFNAATGTGTDNVLVVRGQGVPIENSGGHSKMGELIAAAVHDAVTEAVLKQNGLSADRHLFQRLKEREISLYALTSGVDCDCMNRVGITKKEFSMRVEHLMLESRYAGFMESALALSDEYEKGLIKDLTLFDDWCLAVASSIAGRPVERIEDQISKDQIDKDRVGKDRTGEGQMSEDPMGADEMPVVLKKALNTLFTGVLEQLRHE